MLSHDFIEAPGRRLEIGFNPHETVMMLRCQWCNNAPSKAREDGCAMHELEANGKIRLDVFNPDGMERFDKRMCVTCQMPIMQHWLRPESREYWCNDEWTQSSGGIEHTEWEIPEGFEAKYKQPLSGRNSLEL